MVDPGDHDRWGGGQRDGAVEKAPGGTPGERGERSAGESEARRDETEEARKAGGEGEGEEGKEEEAKGVPGVWVLPPAGLSHFPTRSRETFFAQRPAGWTRQMLVRARTPSPPPTRPPHHHRFSQHGVG